MPTSDYTVVTGSGHGIGKAYALELAARGMNVIIISLGLDDCIYVAQEIGTQC